MYAAQALCFEKQVNSSLNPFGARLQISGLQILAFSGQNLVAAQAMENQLFAYNVFLPLLWQTDAKKHN